MRRVTCQWVKQRLKFHRNSFWKIVKRMSCTEIPIVYCTAFFALFLIDKLKASFDWTRCELHSNLYADADIALSLSLIAITGRCTERITHPTGKWDFGLFGLEPILNSIQWIPIHEQNIIYFVYHLTNRSHSKWQKKSHRVAVSGDWGCLTTPFPRSTEFDFSHTIMAENIVMLCFALRFEVSKNAM